MIMTFCTIPIVLRVWMYMCERGFKPFILISNTLYYLLGVYVVYMGFDV